VREALNRAFPRLSACLKGERCRDVARPTPSQATAVRRPPSHDASVVRCSF